MASAKEEEDDTRLAIPTKILDDVSPSQERSKFLSSIMEQTDDKFDNSVKSYEAIKRNPAVFESAKRFLADRHNMTNVKDEDVIDEFISHFLSLIHI